MNARSEATTIVTSESLERTVDGSSSSRAARPRSELQGLGRAVPTGDPDEGPFGVRPAVQADAVATPARCGLGGRVRAEGLLEPDPGRQLAMGGGGEKTRS